MNDVYKKKELPANNSIGDWKGITDQSPNFKASPVTIFPFFFALFTFFKY